MAKLGTKKKPIVARVHSEEKAKYVAEKCTEHGWHYIIGFEPDKPEDISDLEKMLNPATPAKSIAMRLVHVAVGKNTRNAVVAIEYLHGKPGPNKRIVKDQIFHCTVNDGLIRLSYVETVTNRLSRCMASCKWGTVDRNS
jgi:hypothetical protein